MTAPDSVKVAVPSTREATAPVFKPKGRTLGRQESTTTVPDQLSSTISGYPFVLKAIVIDLSEVGTPEDTCYCGTLEGALLQKLQESANRTQTPVLYAFVSETSWSRNKSGRNIPYFDNVEVAAKNSSRWAVMNPQKKSPTCPHCGQPMPKST